MSCLSSDSSWVLVLLVPLPACLAALPIEPSGIAVNEPALHPFRDASRTSSQTGLHPVGM